MNATFATKLCMLSVLRAGKPTAAKTPTNPVSLFTSHTTHYSACKMTYVLFLLRWLCNPYTQQQPKLIIVVIQRFHSLLPWLL